MQAIEEVLLVMDYVCPKCKMHLQFLPFVFSGRIGDSYGLCPRCYRLYTSQNDQVIEIKNQPSEKWNSSKKRQVIKLITKKEADICLNNTRYVECFTFLAGPILHGYYSKDTQKIFCTPDEQVFHPNTRKRRVAGYDYIKIFGRNNDGVAYFNPWEIKEGRPTIGEIFSKKRISKKTKENTVQVENDTIQIDNSQIFYRIPIVDDRIKNCPFCQTILQKETAKIRIALYNTEGNMQATAAIYADYCLKCRIPFVPVEKELRLIKQAAPLHIWTKSVTKIASAVELIQETTSAPLIHKNNEVVANTPEKEDDIVEPSKFIQVYRLKCHCSQCFYRYGIDTIENRKATVLTTRGKRALIGVQYCQKCGNYYVNIETLKSFSKLYGHPLIELKFEGRLANEFYGMGYSDSILSRHGYTVKAGTPKSERQRVIKYLLDSNISTKYELIELISSFIQIRKYMPEMQKACERWREDIQFINLYQIDRQKYAGTLTLLPHK